MSKHRSAAVQFHIWESPQPRSLEEARDIVYDLLRNEDVPLTERHEEFLRVLWDRFPSDADSVDDVPVWATRVKHRPERHPGVLTVGISAGYVADAQPLVLETAARLDLVVVDSHFFVLFLPNGMELGDRRHLQRVQDGRPI